MSRSWFPVLTLSAVCSLAIEAAEITGVDPPLVLAANALGVGGTQVAILGSGFARADQVKVGGKPLLDETNESATRITGRIPNLSPGFYGVELFSALGLRLASLDRAVEVTAPVTLTSVTPKNLSRSGGTQVTVEGTNFRASTAIRFGSHLLLNPGLGRGGLSITGIAPALDDAEPDGDYDVSAEDSRGRNILRNGVTYFTPFVLDDVIPPLVSTLGGTRVAFLGTGFQPTATLKIGGVNLTGLQYVDSTRITGLSPALSAGIHDAQIIQGGIAAISRTLPDAVEAAPPPLVRDVIPKDVSGVQGTPVVVKGDHFRPVTRVLFGEHEILDAEFVDEETLSGRTPPLAAGEPLGLKNVIARDVRGSGTLENGVNYVAPSPVVLSEVTPGLISTAGGQEVTFTGSGFRSGFELALGGKSLTGVVLVDSSHLKGLTPALEAGFHDATAGAPGARPALLPRAVEAAPPAAIRSIVPSQVSTLGGTGVTIAGAGFRPETVFYLGALELLDPQVASDGSAVTGVAPAQAAGAKDVKAADTRGEAILRGGVTYLAPLDPAIPGPQVTETALAYRKARFDWENLFAYDQIQVLDENDQVVDRLPGTATRYEVDSKGSRMVTLKFRGVTREQGLTKPSTGRATIHQCVVPPPLIGVSEPGKLEFTLYGGHSESGDLPCSEGSPGGGEVAQFDYPKNGLGYLQQTGGAGYVVQGTSYLDINPNLFKAIDSNKLTTGFTLPTDADKLDIGAYYKKVGVAAGLELRVRLIHVFPEDGFADEFPFPETLVKANKEWHDAIYYRSYVDENGVRQPCLDGEGKLMKIPAGEYLLDFYAVGGNPKLPYFTFADDPLDVELLIKGSPCPPYPMVRVTDLTGIRTVPNVLCLQPEIVFLPGDLFPLTVNFHSQGTWIDFDNAVYRIHQDTQICLPQKPAVTDPLNNSPDFEYTWAIYQDEEVPKTKTSGNSPTLFYHHLPDWGCYKVELSIRDKKCGLTSKYSQELAIFPPSIACNATTLNSSTCTSPQRQMKSAYMFPTPNPKNVYAVVGLKPPPGNGSFDGERPVDFRVLIVPCYCGSSDASIKTCPSPSLNDPDDPNDDDVQFRLAIKDGSSYLPLTGAKIVVTDPCAQVVLGPKYLLIHIEDLGEIPYTPALGQLSFKAVYFQARNRFTIDPSDGFTKLAGDSASCFRNIGSPLRLSNRPDCLAVSYWSGSFEPGDASYHFIAKSSQDVEHRFDLGASKSMPIDVPDVDVGVPSYESNDVTTGFTSRFMAVKGKWSDEDATGGMSGNALGNDLQGEPLQVKGTVKSLPGGGILGGDLPYYEWCHKEEIFKNKFSTTLFESIIYTGTIGPVPVTVWASIGLGLDFLIEAYAYVKVSPFGPLDGQNYLDAYFDLKSQIEISIPCEVRADILAGLASIAMKLRPVATFKLIPYLEAANVNLNVDYFMQALFSLYFEIEACIQTFVFGEQCFSPGEIALIENEEIFATQGSQPVRPGNCDSGGGEIAVAGQNTGQGGGVISISSYEVAVAPLTLISPDRKTVVDSWVKETQGTLLQIRVNDLPVKSSPLPGVGYYLIDPSGSFVSNDAALLAWTQPANALDPDQLPADKNDPAYLTQVNQNAATAEVQIVPLVKIAGSWGLYDFLDRHIAALDVPQQVPGTEWRADGRPSVAGDLAAGEALVAWVRYDTTECMIKDGTTVATLPCPKNQLCLCGPNDPGCRFYKTTVPNFRPQIEKTAIFVRRFGYRTEVVQPGNITQAFAEHRSQAFKVSPAGINIEPWISTAPSGQKSYCVWLHDPTHKNLIDQNRGRQVLLAVYTKNAADLDDPAQWSAPQGVLPVPDDYPGLLEPKIYLNGDDSGLLVFTALDQTATLRDSGLGVGRYLFAMRLQGGLFGEPFKVHGKCRKREYGYSQGIFMDIPDLIDPLAKLKWKNPEWVMTYQGLGEIGSRAGSGNVMVTVLGAGKEEWSAPVNLTPDQNIHSNVTGGLGLNGSVHTIHLAGGPASFQAAAAAQGAGVPAERSFVTIDKPLAPDPAIAGCRIDFPYASPGSLVKVTVEVENDGLAGTPVSTDDGRSALGLQLIFIDEAGRESVAARSVVPEIQPGEKTRVESMVEVPLDPVRLRAELIPGTRDLDLTNNLKECNLGAPAPTDFHCEAIPFTEVGEEGEEVESVAVLLTWSSPAAYDEFLIYRDGLMIAALPPGCRRWIDQETTSGAHRYAIRGRISVSKSSRAACALEVVPPPIETFRRGDVDSNRVIEITDAIVLLSFLFLGGAEPGCLDASDADDNGRLEITDAINVLAYLYTGGGPTPPPGPENCGPDPTGDLLPPCRTACR